MYTYILSVILISPNSSNAPSSAIFYTPSKEECLRQADLNEKLVLGINPELQVEAKCIPVHYKK